jgi:hypothetical protein
MAAQCPKPKTRVYDLLWSLAGTARKCFLAEILSKRWLTKEPARVADHVDGEPPVMFGGEKV